ncbi:hypothetical protein [Pseudomonas sp. UBA6310]|uniref:hypothetical protein n=1 Tax=Pseudomonas sp. UBA6310 TaxID=1947327 RepID=UPI002579A4A0|nr:hypothetical protein [Pseudomonas sp. UBA6310]
MEEQLTLDGEPVQKLLHCYIVGEHDYYAASTPEEALQKHADMLECDVEDLDDECEEVTGELLDKPWQDDDGVPLGTLRQWLAEATGPEWLSGTE